MAGDDRQSPEYRPALTERQKSAFEALRGAALDLAQAAVGHNEQMPPLLLALPEDRAQIMTTPLPPDKRAWLPFAKALLGTPGIEAVCLVDEAWIMQRPTAEELARDPALEGFLDGSRSLADAPDSLRSEVVMVTVMDEAEQAFAMCQIDRATRTVRAEELRFMDPSDPALVGRFTRMDGVRQQ